MLDRHCPAHSKPFSETREARNRFLTRRNNLVPYRRRCRDYYRQTEGHVVVGR
jgi:hypothetical protein